METSELRKRLTQTIERAKKQTAERRTRSDAAAQAFDTFLKNIAVPLFRQSANILKSEGYPFTLFTPAGSVRLMSDRVTEDFIELALDVSGDAPQVVGHVSRSRGRRVVETEKNIGAPATLTEAELLDFLDKELEAFVER
jgi:hypothetical protein